MAIPVSTRTKIQAQRTVKQPNLVLCIDGVGECLGAGTIKQVIKIGDPGRLIDGTWLIGGTTTLGGENTSIISMSGSSTSIKQQLDSDKARGSSIQSLDIELVDIDAKATELVSPGVVVDDVLGRKAKIYLALDKDTASWPDDYLLLFRGIIDDIKAAPAAITLTVSHPEQKKKQTVWPKVETKLDGAILFTDTTITVDDASKFLLPVVGPDLTVDNSFSSYVRIGDEIIKFTGISGNQLTGCVRGQLQTVASNHNDDADVFSFYRLQGTAMDLALKMMLSNEGPYLENVTVSTFQLLPGPTSVPNIIFFENMDIAREHGITVGDFISTTGASNGANNVTLKPVTAVAKTGTGSYIEIGGVAFVDESPTSAVMSIRSKYDTLPKALGLGADEVDVAQHEFLRRQYLSSFNYDIYVKETIEDAREFIETELYKPASAYSLPRKTQASAQMLVGPLPGANIARLDKSNIIRPDEIKIRRTINKQFYNTIVYRFDEDELEDDKFRRGRIEQNATSLTRIPVGNRALVINSKGMRDSLNAQNLALQASTRRLNRYKYGAEFIEGLKTTMGIGFDIEVGDIVIFDPTDLNVLDSAAGNRQKPAALFEVINKTLNYKNGEVTLDLLDTAFDESAKYCLVGPSSFVKTGISGTQFVIEQSFLGTYGTAEFQKWFPYTDCAVVVRSPDSVTRYAASTIKTASSNTIELDTNLGFTPQPGDIMELAPYDSVGVTDQVKLVYGHMAPLNGGDDPYQML